MALIVARALIFDMDGLLVDSEPVWWRVEHALCAEHGCTWTDELALSCLGTGLEAAAQTMREQVGLPLSVPEAVKALHAGFEARVDEMELKPGAAELMDAADEAGVPMAVASSSPPHLIDKVLSRFGIAARFAALVSGQTVENPKPAPDVFLVTAERLNIPIADCVVLEDSVGGTTAGVASGAPTIAVPEHNRDKFTSLTPHIVSDLFEARALLSLTP